jgi:hypothetical protein
VTRSTIVQPDDSAAVGGHAKSSPTVYFASRSGDKPFVLIAAAITPRRLIRQTAYIVDIYRGKISDANAAVDRPRLRAVLSAPDRPPNLAAD